MESEKTGDREPGTGDRDPAHPKTQDKTQPVTVPELAASKSIR